MTGYKILADADMRNLAALVLQHIEWGWRPAGGVSFDTNRKEFLQAMVRD